MAAKGYCTTVDVADYLGVALTTAQDGQASALIEQAEIFIDGETNRAWLAGTQTDEEFYRPSHKIFVRYAPIASVSAVTSRTDIGESETTLTAGVDYEIRDAAAGLIYLETPKTYDRIRVDYTPVATVPADIKLACAMIVANWLQPHLQPGTFGLDSYSLPDLTVKFARSHAQSAAPPAAAAILERYRYRVHA